MRETEISFEAAMFRMIFFSLTECSLKREQTLAKSMSWRRIQREVIAKNDFFTLYEERNSCKLTYCTCMKNANVLLNVKKSSCETNVRGGEPLASSHDQQMHALAFIRSALSSSCRYFFRYTFMTFLRRAHVLAKKHVIFVGNYIFIRPVEKGDSVCAK